MSGDEWILADGDTYFRMWTGIGPCGTRDIEKAARFPSKEAAMQSPAFTFALTFYKPVLLAAASRTATGEDTGAVEGTGGYSEPEAPGKNAAPSERGSSSAPHVPSSASASTTGEGEA